MTDRSTREGSGQTATIVPIYEIGVNGAQSRRESFAHKALRYPLGLAGFIVLVAMVILAVASDVIATHDPYATSSRARLQPPSTEHIMGTDGLGRDVFSRLVYGARPSMIIGFGSLVLGVSLGVLLGLLSGYVSGVFDLLVQRLVDAMMSLPSLILAISIIAIIGASYVNLIIAIAIVMIPIVQRVVRGATISAKQNDYVQAALVLGAGHGRVLVRHVLPAVMAPIFVIASVELGSAILVEASLSFLGYGTPPPVPSWGGMISSDARRYMMTAPWLLIFPAIAVSLVILGINMLGDALRDLLDPRLRT